MLQRDIASLCKWEVNRQLEFNTVKCFVTHMSHKRHVLNAINNMKGTPLEAVSVHRHVGVNTTEKLDWSHHCHTTASKSNRTLSVMRRHLKVCSTQDKLTAYKAFVRPPAGILLCKMGLILQDGHGHSNTRAKKSRKFRTFRPGGL